MTEVKHQTLKGQIKEVAKEGKKQAVRFEVSVRPRIATTDQWLRRVRNRV